MKCKECEAEFAVIGNMPSLEELSEISSEQGETELHKMILRDQKEETAKITHKSQNAGE
jgi:hypothetical protein